MTPAQVLAVTDFQSVCQNKLVKMYEIIGKVLKQGEDKGFGDHVSVRTLYGTFAAVMTLVMFLSKSVKTYLSVVRGLGHTQIDRFAEEIIDQQDDWLMIELQDVTLGSWDEVIDLVQTFNEFDELEIFEMYATIHYFIFNVLNSCIILF